MKRNMIICFISHVVISVICFISEMPIYQYGWDNGSSFESENKLLTYGIYALVVLQYIFILFLYYLAGRKFLKLLKSCKLSFLSVWYLAIFYLFINLGTLLFFGFENAYQIMTFTLSLPLFIPFGYGFNLSYIGITAASVLPSLLLWLGMLSKKKKIAHNQRSAL